MIKLSVFIKVFAEKFPLQKNISPWEITGNTPAILLQLMEQLGDQYHISKGIAIHQTAVIENNVTLKAPVVVGENVFIGANAYLREGVYLGNHVKIGPGTEIKSSFIFDHTALAHFNYVGNSIIGSRVNFEAGSIAANHYNERTDKNIRIVFENNIVETGRSKFGALVGDDSKIGANAVLSPGTILNPGTIVKRLELVDQVGNMT